MMTTEKHLVALAAGGTGGHLFPAQALAEVLRDRGHDVHLITDERVREYGKNFPASETHVIPSASLSLSKPLRVPGNAMRLLSGVVRARSLLKATRPSAVVGFGGYPSLPPLWAATMLGIPSIVHEQNAVLGRANKLLSARVTAIATSFEKVFRLTPAAEAKVVLTGNPVRQTALRFAGAVYPATDAASPIKIVVFGGSQGARFFSDVMGEAVGLLAVPLRNRLIITQQCREEDLARVKQLYEALSVPAKLAHFFSNMPEEIAGAHLVVCRSGASSIAELGVIGRPAILVPLPHAIDNDQQKNAESFEKAGAGYIRAQSELTPAALAALLEQLLSHPQALKEAAEAAVRHGKPDAAEKLADLVERKIAARVAAPTGELNA
jgi:UDP-N-acetylglucosamine--N-acetylmuramyl-(pentapeptide) pyrophosphoryl-undecaprenol N-acetylglucosamine transferase